MSEAELPGLHCRLIGGKLEKAQHGTRRWRLPVGLVSDAVGHSVFDPAEAIQHAVRQVFEGFATAKSALAVVKHFAAHPRQLPARLGQRVCRDDVVWRPLRHARVLAMFHHPFSAGAYVYGRTTTRRRPLPGEAPRINGYSRQGKREEWAILLRAPHPGYLSWEQFHRTLAHLDANRTCDAAQRRGASRAGGRGCKASWGVAGAAGA